MQDLILKLKAARHKSELLLIKREIEKEIENLERMTEIYNSDCEELSSEKVNSAKDVEFCSQSYASFYNTKLEKDKSILTLSVAGLGFLITFSNLMGKFLWFEYAIYIVAAIAYLFCAYNVITIFEENALYIIEMVNDSDEVDRMESKLKMYDRRAIYSFYLGIVLSFILGLSTSFSSHIQGGGMSNGNGDNKSGKVQVNDSFSSAKRITESFSGLKDIRPKRESEQPVRKNSTLEPSVKEDKKNG